jgi:hypothetical protein
MNSIYDQTSTLRANLDTLRARRDAIMAEIDAIYTAPAEVEPCGECGNDFEAYNCECEAPTFEHFDY